MSLFLPSGNGMMAVALRWIDGPIRPEAETRTTANSSSEAATRGVGAALAHDDEASAMRQRKALERTAV